MDQEAINRFNEQQVEAQEKAQLLQTIQDAGDKVASAVVQTERNNKSVTITNDLAKPSDIDKVVKAVEAIDLQPQDLAPVTKALDQVSQAIAKLPTQYPEFPDFPEAPEQREDVRVNNLNELKEYFQDVVKAVGALETSIKFDPTIEVKPADVKVTEQKIDLTPVTKGLTNLEKAFKAIKTPNFDTSDIISGLDSVSQTINNLSFPVPNYVLPFKGDDGEGAQIQLVGGALPVSGAGGSTAVDYTTNDIEDGATSYFGKTNTSGTYLIQKVTDTSVSYATITNNGGVTSYTDAWTDRATLTYGRYDEAF